jgi:hypothetical protein
MINLLMQQFAMQTKQTPGQERTYTEKCIHCEQKRCILPFKKEKQRPPPHVQRWE